MLRRELVESLNPNIPYYKLVLYVLAANPTLRVREVPFVMGHREGGQSKVVGTSMKYVTEFLTELLSYGKVAVQTSSKFRRRGLSTRPGPAAREIDPEASREF